MRTKAFFTFTTMLFFLALFACDSNSEIEELNEEIENFLEISSGNILQVNSLLS